MQINIGNIIRELRKKKGITQEQLASVLNISSQAVSKWEMGTGFPDIAMIPSIASYFEVSLDVLFDYNVTAVKENVDKIIRDADEYFFSDPDRYVEIMEDALKRHPGNDALLEVLIENYISVGQRKSKEELIEMCQKLIVESNDFVRVCRVKGNLAELYKYRDECKKAKEILETLPVQVYLRNDAKAAILVGKDKVNAASLAWAYHIVPMYQALIEQGDGWFHMSETGDSFETVSPEEYIPTALLCYQRGYRIIEVFLPEERHGQHDYIWEGMQTSHYSFYQRAAACYHRLGRIQDCEEAIREAYRIVSGGWDDFEENRDKIMKPFNQYLRDYGLEAYVIE